MRILRTMTGVAAELVAGGVRVRAENGATPADVNDALVRAGIRVSALVPERDTLEDVFFTLVEGADVPR